MRIFFISGLALILASAAFGQTDTMNLDTNSIWGGFTELAPTPPGWPYPLSPGWYFFAGFGVGFGPCLWSWFRRQADQQLLSHFGASND